MKQTAKKMFSFSLVVLLSMTFCIVGYSQNQDLTNSIKNRMQLTNVPTVYITVPSAVGKDINSVLYKNRQTNISEYVDATIQVVDNSDASSAQHLESFTDAVQIKVRGNSTADFDKKPYRLKFGKDEADGTSHKHDLLGLGYKKRNWAMFAMYLDQSMMHNALTYHIGKALGIPFCPGYKFVDVVINDEYRGTYQITDHVEVGKHRIDIDEDTGWYLDAANQNMMENPWLTAGELNISIKNPEVDDAAVATLKNSISTYFNSIQRPTDWTRGNWREYIDENSLVNFVVATELTGDYDGYLQVKMYREADNDKLHFGPLWDKDLAFGNHDNGSTMVFNQNNGSFCWWVQAFMSDPVFVKKVHDRYFQLINNGIEQTMLNTIKVLDKELSQTSALNTAKWGTPNVSWTKTYSSYTEAVTYLTEYITPHISYLNKEIERIYQSKGGDTIEDDTEDTDTGNPDQGIAKTSTYEFKEAREKSLFVPAKAFNPEATSIEITFAHNNEVYWWGNYGFNGNIWNNYSFSTADKSITITITTQNSDILNASQNGMVFMPNGNESIGDVTVTIHNIGVPGAATCQSHTYANKEYEIQSDKTYRRKCDVCGTTETEGAVYYLYKIYKQSKVAEEVYSTSKNYLSENASKYQSTPNTIAYVEAAGLSGTNVVSAGNCTKLVITDGLPIYIPEKCSADEAVYTRNVSSMWGTVCLPFKVVSNDEVKLYALQEVTGDNNTRTMIFAEATKTGGQTPLVFRKVNRGATTVTFTAGRQDNGKITVKATPAEPSQCATAEICSGWQMMGNVGEQTVLTAKDNTGLYYISADQFWHATSTLNVAPFRAYLSTDANSK